MRQYQSKQPDANFGLHDREDGCLLPVTPPRWTRLATTGDVRVDDWDLQPEGRRRKDDAGGQSRLGGRDPARAAHLALGSRPAGGEHLPAVGPPAKGEAQAVFAKDVEPDKLIQQTTIERLDLIGADTSLRGLDLLFHELDKKKRLQKLLDDAAQRL